MLTVSFVGASPLRGGEHLWRGGGSPRGQLGLFSFDRSLLSLGGKRGFERRFFSFGIIPEKESGTRTTLREGKYGLLRENVPLRVFWGKGGGFALQGPVSVRSARTTHKDQGSYLVHTGEEAYLCWPRRKGEESVFYLDPGRKDLGVIFEHIH